MKAEAGTTSRVMHDAGWTGRRDTELTDERLGRGGPPGAHVCALYSEQDERDRLLLHFMQEGLRNGDQCVCLIDDMEPSSMRRRAYGPDGPADARRSGNLGVYPASDVCPRAGELSVQRLITLLDDTPASSADHQWPPLRAATEMSWLHQPGAKELLVCESAVEQVLAERPALFLCIYDLRRLRVGTLVDVLRTHSKVLLDGTAPHDPHCLASTDDPQPTRDAGARYPLAKLRTGRLDGGDQWLSLTGAEVRIAGLVASGMTNRAIADELVVSRHTVDAHLKHMYVKLGIHSRVELTVLALQHGPRAT